MAGAVMIGSCIVYFSMLLNKRKTPELQQLFFYQRYNILYCTFNKKAGVIVAFVLASNCLKNISIAISTLTREK
jgi:hypothetical protein